MYHYKRIARQLAGKAIVILSLSVPALAQNQDLRAIRQILSTEYLYDVSSEILNRGSEDSILMGTDPYTRIEQGDENDYRVMFGSKSYDLGMEFGHDGTSIYVDRLDYQGPAYQYGVGFADRILSINGQSTEHMTWQDAVRTVVQTEQGNVHLKVQRHTSTKNLKIPVKATYQTGVAVYLNPPMSYVYFTNITSLTGWSLEWDAVRWRTQGIRHVVLDLRNCGGGSLRGAAEVLELFAAQDDVLYMTEDRNRKVDYIRAVKTGMLHGMDVTVITGNNTASAAEVIAAGLLDLGYATVVGDTTYGKGVSQSVCDLPSGRIMIFSVNKLYSPTGRCVDRNHGYHGLAPSVLLPRKRFHRDTLRMVAEALDNLATYREKNDSVSVASIEQIRKRLTGSLKDVDAAYIAIAVWADHGRAWAVSQEPYFADRGRSSQEQPRRRR